MLKQVLFILGALFLFFAKAENVEIQKNSSSHLSKSFTAQCQTAETCNYLLVASTSGASFGVTITIYIDTTLAFSGTYTVTNSQPATISFPVESGKTITINYASVTTPSNAMLFTLFDDEMNPVADSQQLEFPAANYCVSTTCAVLFSRTPIGWPTNLAVKFYINEALAAEVNTTANFINLDIAQYDVLKMKIVLDPSTPAIPDGLFAGVLAGANPLIMWYSNYYFTPMILNNTTCSNTPPPPPPNPTGSPFGGLLYPITQQEINEFLARTGTSYSTLWYRETVPDNFADGGNTILA